MDENNLSNVISIFNQCTSSLDKFIEVDKTSVTSLREQTKCLYDGCKEFEGREVDSSLPELIVDGFSDEQIWQELELQNEEFLQIALTHISELSVSSVADSLSFAVAVDISDSSEAEESGDDDEEDGEADSSDVELSDEDDYKNFMKRVTDSTSGMKSLTSLPTFDDSDSSLDEEEQQMKDILDRCEDNGDASEEGSEISQSEDDDPIKQEDKDTDEEVEAYDLTNKKLAKSMKGATPSILKKKKKSTRKQNEVDDKFFKLSDMENFLRNEDIAEERRRLGNDDDDDDDEEAGADDDIDMFAELPSSEDDDADNEEGTRDMKYSAFFDPPSSSDDNGDDQETEVRVKKTKKSVFINEENNTVSSDPKQDLLQSDSSSDDDDLQDKSTFEMRQERMQEKIKRLEKASLDSKSWQMTGEVAAIRRPENSLLQEHLDFDHTTRPAPEITEDTTATLEAFIIQRIKDHIFDDVERKVKPKDTASEFKKTAVLNEEKSKLSLGEIYEAEFQKQVSASKGEEQADVEDPKRVEIKKMMSSLFLKLDALSNFHFTPKQGAVEIRMISNQPSITVEDVAPVTASEATRLAPEEIMDNQKGDYKGETERDSTDKKRALRKKKKDQHDKRIHREKKDAEKLKENNGKILSKSQALRTINSNTSKQVKFIKGDSEKTKLTSSKQFFSKLQDEVDNQIYSKKAELNKKKLNKSKLSSAKLKL